MVPGSGVKLAMGLVLFKKKKQKKSAGRVFDFLLTKPIFVGRDEGDVRHDV